MSEGEKRRRRGGKDRDELVEEREIKVTKSRIKKLNQISKRGKK